MILVTGATGFLGTALTRALLARGDRVRALGRDARRCALLRALGADVRMGDLRDRRCTFDACAGVRAVVHAGALSSPWGRAAEFHAINVDGTRHVVDGCTAHGVARLVHISSPSVTFDGRDQRAVTEQAPYPHRFTSVYSATKKRAEDLVHAAGRDGLAVVTLRPKPMFGPGDTTLLPRLLRAGRDGRLAQIGDGANLVDLVSFPDRLTAESRLLRFRSGHAEVEIQ